MVVSKRHWDTVELASQLLLGMVGIRRTCGAFSGLCRIRKLLLRRVWKKKYLAAQQHYGAVFEERQTRELTDLVSECDHFAIYRENEF